MSIHNTKQKLKPKWQDYMFTMKSTPYLHNSFSTLIYGNFWDEPNADYPSSKSENTFVVLNNSMSIPNDKTTVVTTTFGDTSVNDVLI